jgi:hypothetical protein
MQTLLKTNTEPQTKFLRRETKKRITFSWRWHVAGGKTGSIVKDYSSCAACPEGTYGTATGATSSAACQTCSPGLYATASGATSPAICSGCPAGAYHSTASSPCIPPRGLTWLFKDLGTGFYYLNLPQPVMAERNYGVVEHTRWDKVRIHSNLSRSMRQVQLYVQYLGDSVSPCGSATMDTTYATLVPPATLFTDFGSASDCYFKRASTRMVLEGTPFSVPGPDPSSSWTHDFPGPIRCSWASRMSVACSSASRQDCTVEIVGSCGMAAFHGLLDVIDAEQFAADVLVACALNRSDPLLGCIGDERFCSDPCRTCAAGTYGSAAGASLCEACWAGTFSTSIGMVSCWLIDSNVCFVVILALWCKITVWPCCANSQLYVFDACYQHQSHACYQH